MAKAAARLIHKTDKRVTQKLASGIIVRQDFRTAARFVFFETGVDEWVYGTHGGTLFIVNYQGKAYAITCEHVLQDFDWHQLVITDQRTGSAVSGLKSVFSPSEPEDGAVDSDFLQTRIIELSENTSPEFFKDAAYIIDANTIGTPVSETN